jgi:hypothetical protein
VLLRGVKPLKSDRGYTWLHSLFEISPFKKHHALAWKDNAASFLATQVTGVLFKTTSPKGDHPRYAVGLFSRVCFTRTPRRMYRWEQENVYQTLENKTMSTE